MRELMLVYCQQEFRTNNMLTGSDPPVHPDNFLARMAQRSGTRKSLEDHGR